MADVEVKKGKAGGVVIDDYESKSTIELNDIEAMGLAVLIIRILRED